MANADREGLEKRARIRINDEQELPPAFGSGNTPGEIRNPSIQGLPNREPGEVQRPCTDKEPKRPGWWATEPGLGRVVNGMANRVD